MSYPSPLLALFFTLFTLQVGSGLFIRIPTKEGERDKIHLQTSPLVTNWWFFGWQTNGGKRETIDCNEVKELFLGLLSVHFLTPVYDQKSGEPRKARDIRLFWRFITYLSDLWLSCWVPERLMVCWKPFGSSGSNQSVHTNNHLIQWLNKQKNPKRPRSVVELNWPSALIASWKNNWCVLLQRHLIKVNGRAETWIKVFLRSPYPSGLRDLPSGRKDTGLRSQKHLTEHEGSGLFPEQLMETQCTVGFLFPRCGPRGWAGISLTTVMWADRWMLTACSVGQSVGGSWVQTAVSEALQKEGDTALLP